MVEHQSLKTQKRIRIQIPQSYRQEPVLSHLVSQYGLEINISAALLDNKGTGGGWFDLQLIGTKTQINNAMTYLSDLNTQLWQETSAEND